MSGRYGLRLEGESSAQGSDGWVGRGSPDAEDPYEDGCDPAASAPYEAGDHCGSADSY